MIASAAPTLLVQSLRPLESEPTHLRIGCHPACRNFTRCDSQHLLRRRLIVFHAFLSHKEAVVLKAELSEGVKPVGVFGREHTFGLIHHGFECREKHNPLVFCRRTVVFIVNLFADFVYIELARAQVL